MSDSDIQSGNRDLDRRRFLRAFAVGGVTLGAACYSTKRHG
jgi:hypothetical protein